MRRAGLRRRFLVILLGVLLSVTVVWAQGKPGSVKWKFQTGAEVSSSPAIGPDGTVYVGSYNGSLYAIRPDGTMRWEFETGAPIFSSPAIGPDGSIYIGNENGDFYAIRPDGKLKWEFDVGSSIYLSYLSPAIGVDGTIYLFASYVYAFAPDGSLKWRVNLTLLAHSV